MAKTLDNIEILGGIIFAHPEHRLVGRTRLQKTVYLLQRLGLNTEYEFDLYHYGPYSEELKDDLRLGSAIGFIDEEDHTSSDGATYYVFQSQKQREIPHLSQKLTRIASEEDSIVLELAATYDAIRQQGKPREDALSKLREMKMSKCEAGRETRALQFLTELGLNG